RAAPAAAKARAAGSRHTSTACRGPAPRQTCRSARSCSSSGGAPVSALLLFLSFAVILAGALLFTNAVEWLGHRLSLGEGAVGSLLAAVGTAMPETLIAVVALLGAAEGADQVAIGAIVGAPFLLGTLAMGLVGLFAYL